MTDPPTTKDKRKDTTRPTQRQNEVVVLSLASLSFPSQYLAMWKPKQDEIR